jgi:hypothetical protein
LKASCWCKAGSPKSDSIDAKRRSCTVPGGAFRYFSA